MVIKWRSIEVMPPDASILGTIQNRTLDARSHPQTHGPVDISWRGARHGDSVRHRAQNVRTLSCAPDAAFFGNRGCLWPGEDIADGSRLCDRRRRGDSRVRSRSSSTLPQSQYSTIARTFLSATAAGTLESLALRATHPAGFRYRIFVGLRAGSLDRAAPENLASLRAWVAQRARALLPGRTIDHAEFRWFQDTIRIDNNRVLQKSNLDHTFLVDLVERTR